MFVLTLISCCLFHSRSPPIQVHRLRESVLAELVAMQSEMFNDKAVKEMARQVRDKEIEVVRRVRLQRVARHHMRHFDFV